MTLDSLPIGPPTAGPDELDKPTAGPRLHVLLLVAAVIGGLIGGGIVAISSTDTGSGTNVTFAPGSNLKLRGGALDMQIGADPLSDVATLTVGSRTIRQ